MDQLLEFATNHIGLFAAFAAVLLALAANEVHGNLRGAQRLPATDAVRMINDRDALIVDVAKVAVRSGSASLRHAAMLHPPLSAVAAMLGGDAQAWTRAVCASPLECLRLTLVGLGR